MYIGTQYTYGPDREGYYRQLKQLGIDHICAGPPEKATEWTVGTTRCRNVGYFRATGRAVRHG